ncbi:MAG: hypothetical protein JO166_16205 [Deltaproteobacteria bacterium]|nr:hypothetical protein [Deltaproteobacteria bacterium]
MSVTSVPAYATLSAHAQRGEDIVEITVPGKNPEVCVIPKHFVNGTYSEEDRNAETRLCEINENSNAAVCPKTNSTNPGLDLYSLPQGLTPKQVEQARCKAPGAKKLAKYKLSTSCSYTPSILGYYHLSRMLGGITNVPPAVLRTFDLQHHIDLGRIALAETPRNALIHQTWAGLMSQLTAGGTGSRRDLLLTEDLTQSYGALSQNPAKEKIYKEFFNGGSNNVGRAVNFRDKNPIFALLARNADINTIVGRSFTAENVQKMVQLRDAANLIVIDTLMNQQDRFGNIHYYETYYYHDSKDRNPGGTVKLKSSRNFTPEQAAQAGAVQVKEMLLKDNDCGVTKRNVAKEAGLADRVAHIDTDTYRRLLQLDSAADSPEMKRFFVQELVFTQSDYAHVRKNLKELVTQLHDGCSRGKLRLDLNLQSHFSDLAPRMQSCEL